MERERRLAEHQFSLGRAARALPHYRRALLGEPDSIQLSLRVGQCLERLGRTDESYDFFRGILQRGIARCDEPLQREILLAHTNLCLRIGRVIEVSDILGSHGPLVEQTPALFYNLGIAHYKSGRYEEAAGSFEKLRAVHPNNSAGYVGQAILHCHFNRLDAAAQVLQEARRMAPGDIQIIENLAVVQMKSGNPLGAVTAIRQSLPTFRRNPKLLHLLGMAHLRLGDLARAEVELQKSLEISRSPEALRELGWLRVAKGDYPGGMVFLKEALQINPNDIWAKVDLAVAYFKQGITAEAQVLFDEARAAAPSSDVSRLLDDLARLIAVGQKP